MRKLKEYNEKIEGIQWEDWRNIMRRLKEFNEKMEGI